LELSIRDFDFLDSFDHLNSYELDDYGKNKIDLFSLKINANDFDYESLKLNLLDPLIDFSLSRKTREKYSNKEATLSRKAREKFVSYINNKGELGELLLYCFLESHLKAPKILSKLELKTSTSHYVNGADGVHFLKGEDGNYQLIFGESKTIKGITQALTDAFKSIYEFKNSINDKGKQKSGINYEKGLVSDHLGKEVFSEEEKRFVEKIIYPTRNTTFYVDDAFGIFIGYELNICDEDKKLPNNTFREKVKSNVRDEVEKAFPHINKKINEFGLEGHHFYIYILPFTDLEQSRKNIQEDISK